jgi:hypothetical protein
MTQSSQDPNWLVIWLTVLVPAALIAIGAFVKRIFTSVTRAELADMLKEQEERREKQRLEFHHENLSNFRTVFERLGRVEQSQARTEGMLSGRYPQVKGP